MMMQSDPIKSTASNRTILDCIVPTMSAKLYNQLGFMMGFKLHSGRDPLPAVDDRNSHPRQLSCSVEPLTQEQGDVSWYIMRRHSCTSSAMDIVLLRKKASFIEVDHQVWDEYEIVFAYAGINIPLPGSTNINYNSFDNNDSDDSGSLSDYSLHDESVTVTDINAGYE